MNPTPYNISALVALGFVLADGGTLAARGDHDDEGPA
jgi:hypothetical protein